MWGGGLVTVELMSESHTDKIVCFSFKEQNFVASWRTTIHNSSQKEKNNIYIYIFVLSMHFFYLGGKLVT